MLLVNLTGRFAPQILQTLGVVAPYASINNFGVVGIPFLPDDETVDPGHRIVQRVVDASAHVVLDGQDPSFELPSGDKLHEHGAVTIWADYPPIDVQIVVDGTNCLGMGYAAPAGHPPTMQPIPTDVGLFHELSHAAALVNRVWLEEPTPEQFESAALLEENRYRRWRNYPERFNTTGQPLCTVTPTSNTEKGFNWGCFIATAAYGPADHPRVEALRALRDGVLRRTRAGADFFQRFWQQYYRLSPRIVDEMNADPAVRDLVRWSMVEPMMSFFEMAIDMPRGDLAALPEPWRGFLEGARGKLDAWLAEIDVPTSFEGRSPGQVVEELGVLMRYVLRNPERRRKYLDTLCAAGTLPLAEEPRYREILHGFQLDASEIAAILGPASTVPSARAHATLRP